MDNLLETNFYLFIIVIYIIVLSIAGFFFGLMAFFENYGTITFKEFVMTVFKGLFVIVLVSFVLGTITYVGSSLFCDMGFDASGAPENPYF